MSIEALWSVHFATQGGAGGGVVIFETGKLFGGDSQYYWVGNYTEQNGQLVADLDVTHYSGPPYSAFGPLHNFRLRLLATPPNITGPGTTMQATGALANNPNAQIVMMLTYRAPLP
jgi:hypothetical protein